MRPPRWPPSVPPTPWAPPPARPAFIPPLPPPPRGFAGPPRFFPCPPMGFYPRFLPPPRPPVVNAEQLWLDSFRRTHCSSAAANAKDIADGCDEPPLRLLRRRVMQTQKLLEQLKTAATELAAVEKRLEASSANTEERGDAALSVEAPRLRVQRERKLATCEALKKQLDEMNAASGLFPEKQLAEIRAFAARVNKKKAYRKRAKLRRRAEANICRAVDSKTLEKAESAGNDKVESKAADGHSKGKGQAGEKDPPPPSQPERVSHEDQPKSLSRPESRPHKQSLDPETLTIDALIAIRRAWDSYIVFPLTPGASTIPPHFVPPPSAPTPQWAVYVSPIAAD
ncbi:hypothetical protein PHYPSEUDO_005494 [Phytophthora pseudosyringae]|uniref:Uncharacterized protein n=1 Tax=Phytophthora pseudosyringae TaxID=221518 RepID=A0A8T1VNU0_9STRA|nr:hypothetical protein PHYPSEUDO_005494 [Phytophthora pseudosyringae]